MILIKKQPHKTKMIELNIQNDLKIDVWEKFERDVCTDVWNNVRKNVYDNVWGNVVKDLRNHTKLK